MTASPPQRSLRYGAVVGALSSLRGRPAVEEIDPSAVGVRYRRGARRGIAPLADVYLPPRPLGPSVVLVHGGGFVIGSRRMKPMRYLASRLTAAGIAVCAVDYRMIFRGGRLDEALDDVTSALGFWSARASEHGLDPAAISVVGLSAGASLALLAAGRTSGLAGVVCCFGLYQMDHLRGPLGGLLPRLLFRSTDRESWHARSPHGAPQPAAPTLLLHGTDDGLVPVEQAHALAAHRTALGLPTRLVIYPEAPHGFFNLAVPAAEAGVAEIVAHVTGVHR